MNERVRELARRVVGKNKNDVSSISLFDEQIEQFAELIVQECRLAVNRIDVESPEASIALTMADAAIRDCLGVK
jgi:hypothetical protein